MAADVELWRRSLRPADGYFDKGCGRKKSIKLGLCQSVSREAANAKLVSKSETNSK